MRLHGSLPQGGAVVALVAALVAPAPAAETAAAEPEATAGGEEAAPPVFRPPPELPEGFLEVRLGDKMIDVKRAVPKDSDLYEIKDDRDCPLAPAQLCTRIIEKTPRDGDSQYKKAEYLFNPFTERLVRIYVDYRPSRLGPLDLRAKFVEEWGEPTETTEVEVEEESMWGDLIRRTDAWRNAPVEIRLVYRVAPQRPNDPLSGHVEFVHLEQLEWLEKMGAQTQGGGGASDADDEGAEPPPSKRLF